MKRIIIFVLLFAALKVAGQTTGYLRFDTVKIMKQNGTCELYIINKTKDSLGVLTNVGGGLTQFIKPKILNDSTVIIGLDTLVVRGGVGTPQRFGLEDNTTTANRQFDFNGFSFNNDSVSNYNVYTKAKTITADAGVRGQLEISNGTVSLWAVKPGSSTRSYGFNAYAGLTQMYAAGHVPGKSGYVQADTTQVILESDPNRFYLRHDSAMLINIFDGIMDFRIRTLPQTIDTSYKALVSGPHGQVFLRPGDGGGGGGSADSTIFATKYGVDTAKANIRAQISDSLIYALKSILIPSRLEFIASADTASYQDSALIGAQIMMLSIESYQVGFTVRATSVYMSFDSSTGTITLTNGEFAEDDQVIIIYRTPPVFLLDGLGNPVRDIDGNFIILN